MTKVTRSHENQCFNVCCDDAEAHFDHGQVLEDPHNTETSQREDDLLKTLHMRYMKAHEPWTPYDFPKQYMAHVKHGYYPPTFVLGAGITAAEFMRYASEQHSTASIGLPSSQSTSDQYANMLLRMVANLRRYSCRFPTEECVKLLDELEGAGIKADIQWFLAEDHTEWESIDLLDWSQDYLDFLKRRSETRRNRQDVHVVAK
ncbi:hypothetical protein K435DRAFT_872951 [Dendrothele bispora CBS 962.96]|uniref:Uncharacterized protein n=1 Tax=Dendrothele bispora (strain CBS 962.96) TaxID=1314807 RepID=A0A4S8L0C8_DENBC|nr:hypothetical protein K435DRAFT_872951 [Dendrothele bispora CBS 962.96]